MVQESDQDIANNNEDMVEEAVSEVVAKEEIVIDENATIAEVLKDSTSVVTNFMKEIEDVQTFVITGSVVSVKGLSITIRGLTGVLSIGDKCYIDSNEKSILCEVISFKGKDIIVMSFGGVQGISSGNKVRITSSSRYIYPHPSWLGRVINALGEPVDGKGPLMRGNIPYLIKGMPPSAHSRKRVGGKVDVGVKSLNAFLTCCNGQRMGIFAGSGVGKSSLMSNITRGTDADITVVGLVGERGREAREFIEDDLGEEGLKRSIVVVATSDESALMRRQAAYVTFTVSEYFRDLKQDVLCLMDSVTRFAMAQREIGLSVGEPPTSKGYTPSVFVELAALLERAGPGTEEQGQITGLFTVLVDGDDHDEPISDAVRGILDGHIVLDRKIAERGRFPSVNILRSVSRTMPMCNNNEQNAVIQAARSIISTYEEQEELIKLGAYKIGTNEDIDRSIALYPRIEQFIRQAKGESFNLRTSYHLLAKALMVPFEGVLYNDPETEIPEQIMAGLAFQVAGDEDLEMPTVENQGYENPDYDAQPAVPAGASLSDSDLDDFLKDINNDFQSNANVDNDNNFNL